MKKQSFLRLVCNLAIPVALQSMLQSSFSIIDQIMVGQLGSVSIAGVGMAGKFSSIFSVLVAAIGAVAGIMISQYMGQENKKEIRRSFYLNLTIALGMAVGFTVLCVLLPSQIMGFYTKDEAVLQESASYLRIVSATFLPIAGATLLSTMFRCMEKAMIPLYASIAAALFNTGLNYILIFGKFGISPMGAKGAAVATVVSQMVNFLIMLVMIIPNSQYLKESKGRINSITLSQENSLHVSEIQNTVIQDTAIQDVATEGFEKQGGKNKFNWKQYIGILFPILFCELAWSLGENVYAAIYGNMGTDASAAMTLINPVQGLMIGALCGLSQAAGVLIGKMLGNEEYDEAYSSSKKLIIYGFVGSAVLSVVIILTRGLYVQIYQVEDTVRVLTEQILLAYSIVAPFKVLNMTLGGGILRSGGKTKYVMVIDIIGTWGFGVPLGLLAANILQLSISYVYFILSLEECVRFGISILVLRRKKWMKLLS